MALEKTYYSKRIILRNRIEELDRMVMFLEEIGQDLDLSVEVAFNIHLALEEAVTNVIMYAYPKDEEHDIEVTVSGDDNGLTFKIIDSGNEFDPTLQPDADVTLPLEDRPIGGLGIFLIRKMMEKVQYSRVEGKNILALTKDLKREM